MAGVWAVASLYAHVSISVIHWLQEHPSCIGTYQTWAQTPEEKPPVAHITTHILTHITSLMFKNALVQDSIKSYEMRLDFKCKWTDSIYYAIFRVSKQVEKNPDMILLTVERHLLKLYDIICP